MRAATIRELNGAAGLTEVSEPQAGPGEVRVKLLAAPLNQLDLTISRGLFGGGHPPLPYIPGIEGVGTIEGSSTKVYVMGGGLGLARQGAAAEWFVTPEALPIQIGADLDAVLAAALGTPGLAAWLALEWKGALKPGETVVVVGATGTAGRLAVQFARRMGAGSIVAVGREPERLSDLEGLADAVVSSADADYPKSLANACGAGANLVIDFTWGQPLEGVIGSTAPGCRIVHVGATAGPTATLPSSLLRARQLTVYGFTNFAVPRDILVDTYQRMLHEAAHQPFALSIETFALDRADAAWAGLVSGSRKVVLTP